MAQSGYTPISLYYSTTAATAPTAGNLVNGELAINITDGKLYYKDNSGVVQVIASKSAAGATISFGTTGLTPSTATALGNVTVAGTLNVANGGTGLTSLSASYIPYGNGTSAFNSSSNLYFSGQSLVASNTAATTGPTLASFAVNGFGGNNLGLNVSSNAEAYVVNTASTKYQYYQAGTVAAFTNVANSVNSGALIDFGAYNSSNGATDVYIGAVAGGSVNGPANFVVGRRTSVTSWAESLRVDASGNLGVGTSSPAAKLDVVLNDNSFGAGLNITNSNAGSSAQSKLNLINSSGNYLALIQNSASVNSGVAYVGTNSTQALTMGTGFAEAMRITSAGNVGIGTSGPNAVLDVTGGVGTFNSTIYTQSSTADMGVAIFSSNNAGTPSLRLLNNLNSHRIWLKGDGSGDLYFAAPWNATTPNVTFQGGGNVGIGTSSPGTKVDIVNNTAVYTRAYNTNATAGNAGFICQNSAKSYYIIVDAVNSLQFYDGTAGSQRMVINSSGYVGIGNSSPAIPLSVTGMAYIGGVFSGLVKNSLNNNNAFDAIGQLGAGAGIIFSGFVYIGSYTGNCQINVQIATDYTNDNVAYQVVSTGAVSVGPQAKTTIQLVKATVGGLSYLGFLKNGGGTGNMYLNAFVQAGVNYPFETASGSFTVTSTIATLN